MLYIGFLLLFLIVIFSLLYVFQEKFIFLNGKIIPKEYSYRFTSKFEELFITTESSSINALHFKLKNPKGVVLFNHGNKGNLMKWGEKVNFFLKYNYEVLVYDYRSYGKSKGKFDEDEMYNDALEVYNHLKAYYEERNIVVYGFSLGSTFATKIASINNPKHLILEAPFFNFEKAVRFVTKLVPSFLLKYQFRTDIDIQNVKCPITIFHGNLDKTTSFKESKELYRLINTQNKEFVMVNQGTHHNIKDFAIYKKKLKEILHS